MQKIPLSTIQQNIYSIIETVVHSQQPVLIIDNDKYLVKITPITYSKSKSWLGSMTDTGEILGDIITPVIDANDWQTLAQ